jgi:hypothetical protein
MEWKQEMDSPNWSYCQTEIQLKGNSPSQQASCRVQTQNLGVPGGQGLYC